MLDENTELIKSVWIKQEKIGSGAYGDVYRGINSHNSQLIAIKKIKTPMTEFGIPVDTLRETNLLNTLTHPNIIQILDVIYVDENMYIVFEYMSADLKEFIDSFKNAPIPMKLIKEILKQILQGLNYLSFNGVLHRDLKPQNILINYKPDTEDVQVKVADFGMARIYSYYTKKLSQQVVTPLYRAPEIFLESIDYNHSIDMWSVGCIFAELVNKLPLFIANSEIEVLFGIFKMLGLPLNSSMLRNYPNLKNLKTEKKSWNEICPGLDTIGLDLLSKMLTVDPDRRITAQQALQHDFFKN